MKKFLAALLAMCMVCSLTACSSGGTTDPADSNTGDESGNTAESSGATTEVIVFAAASLTETLEQIAEDYKRCV